MKSSQSNRSATNTARTASTIQSLEDFERASERDQDLFLLAQIEAAESRAKAQGSEARAWIGRVESRLSLERHTSPRFLRVEEAAAHLGLTDKALRARCRRHARKNADGTISSCMGGGIVAFKFGRSWRFQFPSEEKR